MFDGERKILMTEGLFMQLLGMIDPDGAISVEWGEPTLELVQHWEPVLTVKTDSEFYLSKKTQ